MAGFTVWAQIIADLPFEEVLAFIPVDFTPGPVEVTFTHGDLRITRTVLVQPGETREDVARTLIDEACFTLELEGAYSDPAAPPVDIFHATSQCIEATIEEAISRGETSPDFYVRVILPFADLAPAAEFALQIARRQGVESYVVPTPAGTDVVACPTGGPYRWKLELVADRLESDRAEVSQALRLIPPK